MDKLVIQGGRPLTGTIHVGGSKNTALPLMAAALLADGVTTIHNIPVLKDVATFSNVIRVTGATVTWAPTTTRTRRRRSPSTRAASTTTRRRTTW